MSYEGCALSLDELLKETTQAFLDLGILAAESDAEWMMSEYFALAPSELRLSGRTVSREELTSFHDLIKRRLENEPPQYIFNKAYFRDLILKVGPGVLIPRPETELLIDIAAQKTPQDGVLADVCAGSGAIAIALAMIRPDLRVIAIELCDRAIKYAIKNSENYCLGKKFQLIRSDLLNACAYESFDVIVSNPPYVTPLEWRSLEPEVKDFEPEAALLGGEDGFAIINRLILDAPRSLKSQGYLVMELGEGQAERVEELLFEQGSYEDIEVFKDYNGVNRFVSAKKNR